MSITFLGNCSFNPAPITLKRCLAPFYLKPNIDYAQALHAAVRKNSSPNFLASCYTANFMSSEAELAGL